MKLSITISDMIIADVLVSGLEGGSNYWLQIEDIIDPKMMKFRLDDKQIFGYIDAPMNAGGALIITDINTGKKHKLTKAKLVKGIKQMAKAYTSHFNNIVSESFDAETGDVLLQCAIFNDIIYG